MLPALPLRESAILGFGSSSASQLEDWLRLDALLLDSRALHERFVGKWLAETIRCALDRRHVPGMGDLEDADS